MDYMTAITRKKTLRNKDIFIAILFTLMLMCAMALEAYRAEHNDIERSRASSITSISSISSIHYIATTSSLPVLPYPSATNIRTKTMTKTTMKTHDSLPYIRVIFPFFYPNLSTITSAISAKHISATTQKNIPTTSPKKLSLDQLQAKTTAAITQHTIAPYATVQHTSAIGTPDHPTIDGGIINAAGVTPIQAATINTMNANTLNINQLNFSHATNMPEFRAFSDDWATSERVKNLLTIAARNGKLEYVLHRTDEKGLPASVATVPMIESQYQDLATSTKGAAGAWQLMEHTARDYGLAKEERYKFTAATNAALNLLHDLHRKFHSWELAFAAYNAGTKTVQNALRKNPYANSVQELELPQETKIYVARIMALNKIIEQNSRTP